MVERRPGCDLRVQTPDLDRGARAYFATFRSVHKILLASVYSSTHIKRLEQRLALEKVGELLNGYESQHDTDGNLSKFNRVTFCEYQIAKRNAIKFR